MFDFQVKHFLTQLVKKPTHKAGNTLDLVFTNNRHLFGEISTSKTIFSDHHHVEVSTYFKSHFTRSQNSTRSFSNIFDSLNFFSEDVNWEELESSLQQVDWPSEFVDKNPDEQFNHFVATCENIAQLHVPLKRSTAPKRKSKIPRDRRILMRRRTKINKQLAKHQPPSKRQQLINELVDIELKFQESYARSLTDKNKKLLRQSRKTLNISLLM